MSFNEQELIAIYTSPAHRYPFIILVLSDHQARANWRHFYRALSWAAGKLLIVGPRKTLDAMQKDRPSDIQKPALAAIDELSDWDG